MPKSIPSRSPWIEQLERDRAPHPLDADVTTDVAIVGAGIAGVATAFFVLRDTNKSVLLIERGRVGHGATGHNAGQLATYFERPLRDLVDEYGFDMAIAAQRAIDDTWDLLDQMVNDCNVRARIDRFIGHMGMFTLNHIEVHLHHSLLRQRGGLRVPDVIVSEDAPYLSEIPAEYANLYSVVPAARVREVLGTTDDRYNSVMSDHKGCGNSALLIEQVLEHLEVTFADRFRFVDHTDVSRIVLDRANATIFAGEHQVKARTVVMCTNGFVDHVIENRSGGEIEATMHHRVAGTVGYMTGYVESTTADANAFSYIRNEVIGESTPYVYLTRRPYEHPTNPGTLSCMGGPEVILNERATYDPDADFPAAMLTEFDTEILPIVQSARPAGLAYDYAWHGLMGYNESRVRLIGYEPRNPVLMYNLGCNGVGFMPSIYGGFRIARLLFGDQLEPSIFDPS